MIDEERTFEIYGYTSDTLSNGSGKKVVAACDDCGTYRDVLFYHYRDLCASCCQKGCYRSKETKNRNVAAARGQVCSDETKRKMSEARKGKPFSEKHKRRIAENHIGFSGRKPTDEHKKKISASLQGIPYDKWEHFAKNSQYCPRFDDACRESNREKYGRKCFICELTESENITSSGKQKKLSVHHADMQKGQGCDGVKWKLVPVCLKCHRPLHNEMWKARIVYLLNNVWCD